MLKELCNGNEISDRNELLSLIAYLSHGIDEETLPNIFRNWITRLRSMIKHGGEYCTI
jgi:hypothetical protein